MKQLFNHNPEQNAMADAYENMLKEEHEAGVPNHTANFFEDILVESTGSEILPENAVIRNEDGTIKITMESINADQWEVLKKLVRV
jgi:hypothetical protein